MCLLPTDCSLQDKKLAKHLIIKYFFINNTILKKWLEILRNKIPEFNRLYLQEDK